MARRIYIHSTSKSTGGRTAVYGICIGFLLLYLGTIPVASDITERYESLQTELWRDRSGVVLLPKANERGFFSSPAGNVPELFETLLLRKEDRFFYYHLGVNPFSMVRGIASLFQSGGSGGSSTITQQLAKILLGNEAKRTVANKLIESAYAFALELHLSKREILTMYENTAYFGKNRQGIGEASRYFFNKQPTSLTEQEMLQLITALGSPSTRFPGSPKNDALFPSVAEAVSSDVSFASTTIRRTSLSSSKEAIFELQSFNLACDPCDLTIDATLTKEIREVLRRHLASAEDSNVENGAIVVLKLPENELLAIIGSPDPRSLVDGAQLNMALQPRPIGSTAKPFIYLNAFEKGARPYTLIEDEEYSYRIGTGFAFYPKNFDGKFRGTVTLHNALSNSLNVPAVKTLEYVGLPRFYRFLNETLRFVPRQPLSRYELGIALGALEMDLLTLSHFFTIFPNEGVLRPLTLQKSEPGLLSAPMEVLQKETRVAPKTYTQLVTKILADRETAVEQFGLRSNLTLPYKNYALKTGTSRDYHDSWTIGFTPDFLVGVWLGNSDNTPMRELTGQTGAGAIWQDVMTLMYTSSYNKSTPFHFDTVKEFTDSGSVEYGLAGDDYAALRNLMKDHSLILSPHDGDTIELSDKTVIPLVAREPVDWFIDEKFLIHAKETSSSPTKEGKIKIEAKSLKKAELVDIYLISEN
ncbi:MAG: hypothetical protein EXS51_02420 [Candidatus Taylorbacteria bacterium]|nr:hypothetical protein [Candidatus Taylorbacteria bacterium]